MLKIIEGKLTYDGETVSSADQTVELLADVDCRAIGVLRYPNGIERSVIPYDAGAKLKRFRLVFSEDGLNGLSESRFRVILVSGPLTKQTNEVALRFDVDGIRRTIRASASKEIIELRKKLSSIEFKIDALSSSGYIKRISMADVPTKPGMIPVAVDGKGNYLPCFPFNDFVSKVNGVKAADGEVEISADVIKYGHDKTVAEGLDRQSAAILAISSAISTLADELKKLANRIGEVEKRLEAHMADGII